MGLRSGTILVLTLSFVGCSALGRFSPLRPLERSLVFQPVPFPTGDWEPASISPDDVSFTAKDGTRLHGWYVRHPAPQGIALFCHGNAGNVSALAETIQVLNQRHRLSIMAFDYRGYGLSEGRPSEEGVYQDARAARAWLARRENVPEREIIVMGQSLGGAVAVELAAKDGAKALVLASTFTTLPEVASQFVRVIPASWLMTYRFDSIQKIRDYRGPLLVSHGTADEVVPFKLGQQLFEAAGTDEKYFFPIPGGRHNDPLPEEYRIEFERFLRGLPGKGPDPETH